MTDISQVEDIDCLKYVIARELKAIGIKVPKGKKSTQQDHGNIAGVFGSRLGYLPSLIVDHETGCTVPKFLVEAVSFLEQQLTCEGLFRKSGSHLRQKELKQNIQNGGTIPDSAHVYDVASLFKQFFRELCEPLLTNRLCDTFVKCCQIEDAKDSQYAVMLLCNLLPLSHLHSLQYVMKFLKRVSENSADNKMDISNLSVVLAPNLMGNIDKSEKLNTIADKLLRARTLVIQQLIADAHQIGQIPDSIMARVMTCSGQTESYSCDGLTSEDDLDRSTEGILERKKWKRKKRRSGSLSGIVSGLGQSLGLLKSSGNNSVKTPASPTTDASAVFDNKSTCDNYAVSPHDSVVPAGETPMIRRSTKRKAHEEMGAFSAAKRKAMLYQLHSDPKYSKQGIHIHKSTPIGVGTPMTPLRAPRSAIGESSAATELFGFMSPSIKYADESMGSVSSSPSVRQLDDSDDFLLQSTLSSKGKSKAKFKKIKRRSSSNAGSGCFSPRTDNKRRSLRLKLRQRSVSVQGTPTKSCKEDTVGWRLANAPPVVGLDTLHFDLLRNQPTSSMTTTPSEDKKAKGLFKKHKKTPSSPGRLLSDESSGLKLSAAKSVNDSLVIENAQVLHPPSPPPKHRAKSHLTQVQKSEEKPPTSPKVVTVDVHMHSPANATRTRKASSSKTPVNITTVTAKPPAHKPIGQKQKTPHSRHTANLKPQSPIQLKKEQLARRAKHESRMAYQAQVDSGETAKKSKVTSRAKSESEESTSAVFVKPKPILKSSKSLPEQLEMAKVHLPSKTKPGVETRQGRPILTASMSLPEALDRIADADGSARITRSTSCRSVYSVRSGVSNSIDPPGTLASAEKPSHEPSQPLSCESEPMVVDSDSTNSGTARDVGKEPLVGNQEGSEVACADTLNPKMRRSVSVDSGKGRSMFDLTEIDAVKSRAADGEAAKNACMSKECGTETTSWEQRNISLGSIDSALDTTMGDEPSEDRDTKGEGEMEKIQCEEMECGENQNTTITNGLDQIALSPSDDNTSVGKDSFDERHADMETKYGSTASNAGGTLAQPREDIMTGLILNTGKVSHSCSESDIRDQEGFIEYDDTLDPSPTRITRSYTLPERRPPRRQSSSNCANTSLVQRHIELFNSINRSEITSPLRVSKGPLVFRRAPNRASARLAREKDGDGGEKILKRVTSDQTITGKPTIPITSSLVKSISTDTGLSRLACDTSHVGKESHDMNQSYEEAISSSVHNASSVLANIRIPKSLQETINNVCTPMSERIGKSPLRDNNTMANVQGRLTPMKTLPKKLLLTSQPLTPLHLVSKTKIRAAAANRASLMTGKSKSPVKAVKRLTPRRSPSFKLDSPKLTPTDREMKKYKKSPRYPKSPKSPAKPKRGGKMAMYYVTHDI